MKIFAVRCVAGEYNQNLEFYDHIVCYHESFLSARAKAYKIADQYGITNFRFYESEKDDYFKLVCKDTGDCISINAIEVLP